MKKILPFLLSLLCLCSCEFEGSHNGDLDGFWLLTDIDNLDNGQSHFCRDSLYFWSFQADLMKTQKLGGVTNKKIFVYRFAHEEGNLHVYDPCEYERFNGNQPIDEERLPEIEIFGLPSLDVTYRVDKLNRKRMVLSTSGLCLHFEKY